VKQISDFGIEEMVLGTVILYGSERLHTLVQKFKPELFCSHPRHIQVAEAISWLIDQGIEVELMNVIARLEKIDKLETVGGRMYFTKLMNVLWSDQMLDHHLDLLEEYRIKRQAEMSASLIAVEAGKKNSDVVDLQRLASQLSDTMLLSSGKSKEEFISKVVEDFSTVMINKALSNDWGMSSGFYNIDVKLKGLTPAYYLLAGRPGNGKTAFALNMAYRQARKGHTVGFLSIEMSREELLGRLTSIHLKRCWYDRDKTQSDEEFRAEIQSTHMAIAALPLVIDDTPYKTVETAIGAAYRMRFSANPIEILYIDYVQLLSQTNKPEDLARISHMINALKKDLGIAIVVLAQINREVRDRKGHRPVLTDLKGSGSFEEDADVVMFVFDPDQWSEANAAFELIIAKDRNGPLAMGDGALQFYFDKPAQRFEQGEVKF